MSAENNKPSLVEVYARMGHVLNEIKKDRKLVRRMYSEGEIDQQSKTWALNVTAQLRKDITQTPEYGLFRAFVNRKNGHQDLNSFAK